MAIHMAGNYMFVRPDQKHFIVASNFTNYFEIGDKSSTQYYLEARVEDDEFLVNGRLYVPGCEDWCEIADNLPTGGPCAKTVLQNGYRVEDSNGDLILEILVSQNGLQCNISGTVYDENGTVVADGGSNGFDIHHGPAVIGKSGSARGIVIGGTA